MQNRVQHPLYKQTFRLQITLFLFILSFITLNAQQWIIYDNSNSGLNNNFVNCLHYNSDTLWIGTENGLYSFQNNQWTSFPNQPFYDVRALVSAPDGTIWIGSFLNGLARHKNGIWTYFNTTNSGLQDDYIRSLVYDTTSNTLWIGTSAGLHAYQNSTWSYYDTANSNLPGNNIPCLALEQGTLWGGTINNGLFKLANLQFTTYNLSNSGIGDNTQLDIAVDAQGNKWIATPANGLSVLANTGNWSIFNNINSGISSNSVNCIGIACSEIYAGTATTGISTFGSWTHYDTSTSPLPENEIRSMTNSGDTTLFIGTFGGGLAIFKPCLSTATETTTPPTFEINLFPNPTKNHLNLYFNQATINYYKTVIYATSGKRILESNSNDQHQSIDVSGLVPGQYFIIVEINGNSYTRKFIKLE